MDKNQQKKVHCLDQEQGNKEADSIPRQEEKSVALISKNSCNEEYEKNTDDTEEALHKKMLSSLLISISISGKLKQ